MSIITYCNSSSPYPIRCAYGVGVRYKVRGERITPKESLEVQFIAKRMITSFAAERVKVVGEHICFCEFYEPPTKHIATLISECFGSRIDSIWCAEKGTHKVLWEWKRDNNSH